MVAVIDLTYPSVRIGLRRGLAYREFENDIADGGDAQTFEVQQFDVARRLSIRSILVVEPKEVEYLDHQVDCLVEAIDRVRS